MVSKNNRKGQFGISQLIISIVFLFTFVVIVLFGYKTLNEVNADLQLEDDISTLTKTTVDDLNDRYPTAMDGLVIFILVLLWIFVMVIAFFSDTHPIFYALLFLIIIFLMIVGGILSNAWEEITDESEVSSLVTEFPMTDFILNNYLLVVGVIGFSALIGIILKNRVL